MSLLAHCVFGSDVSSKERVFERKHPEDVLPNLLVGLFSFANFG